MNKIDIYLSILNMEQHNPQVWLLLGEEYLIEGQLGEALHAFSMSVKQGGPTMEAPVLSVLKKHMGSYVFENPPEDSILSNEDTPFNENEITGFGAGPTDTLGNSDEPPSSVNEPPFGRQLGSIHQLEAAATSNGRKLQVIEGTKPNNVILYEEKKREKVTFQDVGGLDALKKTIEMKIIKPYRNPGIFAKFRKKAGGGILLYGPPGCGKTFIAKATAGECDADFHPVHISDILDPYVGVSEQRIHDVFATARANLPAVLFFDELDALGFSRSKSRSDVMRPLVDTLLNELQSVETSNDQLLVIGATNMPWDVDDAFKRPGRFDKLVFVPPPDKGARRAILELKLRGKPVETGIFLDILAEKTEFYSGADLENVVEIATERVLTEIMDGGPERLITMDDLLDSIKQTKPTTTEWLNTIKNYIKYANQGGLYSDAADYIKKHM
ncbi:26S protease regulatory subunit [Bacillus sp. FJAT-27445]|uniref:ATP-binding protein n=1 Tax=Bacillus sp. FJAT-27445 TaxID=1679166 RepID=UPI000743DE0F|nr:AAA family ATPase [Bacillus sp. FJAT-27445]